MNHKSLPILSLVPSSELISLDPNEVFTRSLQHVTTCLDTLGASPLLSQLSSELMHSLWLHVLDTEASIFPRLDDMHTPLLNELSAQHRVLEAILMSLIATAEMSAEEEYQNHLEALQAAWRDHAHQEQQLLLHLFLAIPTTEQTAVFWEMQLRR